MLLFVGSPQAQGNQAIEPASGENGLLLTCCQEVSICARVAMRLVMRTDVDK